MTPNREPPSLARWLLERALPADVRDDVAGDLDEVYRRQRACRHVFGTLDPTLHLYDASPLDGLVDQLSRLNQFLMLLIASVFVLVAVVALLISAAGTYSLMSLTVLRRSREIGIRAALGASPRRILSAIFSRALVQIGLGVVVGSVPFVLLSTFSASEQADATTSGLEQLGFLLTVAAVMTVVGLLAFGLPARRALRIQPTEVLKVG